MPKLPWTPWHQVVRLREDLRSGELALHEFAADLYDVMQKTGQRKVYEDPAQFFALTYPTANLRDLAKDVAWRLAGKNTKAVRQLELTYGGGKTHTLITLFHLAEKPQALPKGLRAVEEFEKHIGLDPLPKARIAVLPFDKIDAEKGMEARDPAGKTRWLRHPWSILAWQIAGEDGLRLLHAEGKSEERESPPAENLMVELLALPEKEDLGTLILIDEVLMYAREKVQQGKEWRGRLQSFFQYLSQATVKCDRTAMVVSLLATDPTKFDEEGRAILHDIQEIFAREKEEGVQPVLKEDVAEVLRRRFFTPESLADRSVFQQHVIAALQGIQNLDPEFKKRIKTEEPRFNSSYPFHPDLTEVFYTKWTQLPKFQRTRGILRIFAIALRDAESWDEGPLVGANILLPKPGLGAISEAARELTGVAVQETEEGAGHNWVAILEGELAKARAAQEEQPGLRYREIEQAVIATFVHSQPANQNQKATLTELIRLIGPTRPERIDFEKGLQGWLGTSWFLDEAADNERKPGAAEVPKVWRLGTRPNLNQMHSAACDRVLPGDVETRVEQEIRGAKSLAVGASAAGAKVHTLPSKPSDVGDDGDFHFAVLGPFAASESGKPSSEARRFIEENTGTTNPRKERNAVVLAVPSRDGLENARHAARQVLGWEVVRQDLKGQDLDPLRAARLDAETRGAAQKLRAAIVQAYCIVVTVGKDNELQAFKIAPSDQSLFSAILEDPRARIQNDAVNSEALLPGGPYDVWREDEEARRVSDIVGAFARFARLPKMLRRDAVEATIVGGIREGLFVGRVQRPDKSVRTFWRAAVQGADLNEVGFELVLPEKADLVSVDPNLLAPGALPGLWNGDSLPFPNLARFFDGSGKLRVQGSGYEDTLAVPKATREVITAAVGEAVQAGRVWLTSGPVSLYRESVPAGVLTDQAMLRKPLDEIGPLELLPESLPAAWTGGESNPRALHAALATKKGLPVPWLVLCNAITYAIKKGLLIVLETGAQWPSLEEKAGQVVLGLSGAKAVAEAGPQKPFGVHTARGALEAHELQNLADAVGAIVQKAGSAGLRIEATLEVGHKEKADTALIEALDEALKKAGVPLKFE